MSFRTRYQTYAHCCPARSWEQLSEAAERNYQCGMPEVPSEKQILTISRTRRGQVRITNRQGHQLLVPTGTQVEIIGQTSIRLAEAFFLKSPVLATLSTRPHDCQFQGLTFVQTGRTIGLRQLRETEGVGRFFQARITILPVAQESSPKPAESSTPPKPPPYAYEQPAHLGGAAA